MIAKNWDIVVVGGGIAGLTITAVIAKLGIKVLCIEPNQPSPDGSKDNKDIRSTAYLLNSIEILKEAGVWRKIQNQAASLEIMQICDTSGSFQESIFDSEEIGLSQFGYNIPNTVTKKALISVIKTTNTAEVIFGLKVGL